LSLGVADEAPGPYLTIAATLGPIRTETEVVTTAMVTGVAAPSEADLRALFDTPPSDAVSPPSVTLALGPAGSEFSVRVDGSAWRPWSTDAAPTLVDDAFLFQGHHRVEARARMPGDFRTEDTAPVSLDVLIDSVPPELHPSGESGRTPRIDFNGYDLVSADSKLVYARNDASGKRVAFGPASSVTLDDALQITNDGGTPLIVFAKDEAGNIGSISIDPRSLFAQPNDAGAVGDASASGGGGANGAGNSAGGSANSGMRDTGRSTLEAADGGLERSATVNTGSGCGCRVHGSRSSAPNAFAAIALVTLAYVRRRRALT
jgi:MYXO-CTERM domain-containing protein